jgi:hypothetical protein
VDHRTFDRFHFQDFRSVAPPPCTARFKRFGSTPGRGDWPGLALRSIYLDAGVSGSSLDRPDLQRLIAECRAGKIDTVITQDSERLSRDTGQLLALLHTFQEAGVRVEFCTAEGRACLWRPSRSTSRRCLSLRKLRRALNRNTANERAEGPRPLAVLEAR